LWSLHVGPVRRSIFVKDEALQLTVVADVAYIACFSSGGVNVFSCRHATFLFGRGLLFGRRLFLGRGLLLGGCNRSTAFPHNPFAIVFFTVVFSEPGASRASTEVHFFPSTENIFAPFGAIADDSTATQFSPRSAPTTQSSGIFSDGHGSYFLLATKKIPM